MAIADLVVDLDTLLPAWASDIAQSVLCGGDLKAELAHSLTAAGGVYAALMEGKYPDLLARRCDIFLVNLAAELGNLGVFVPSDTLNALLLNEFGASAKRLVRQQRNPFERHSRFLSHRDASGTRRCPMKRPHLLLIGVAAIWGSLFLLAKTSSAESVPAFLTARFGFATLALLPFALRRRKRPSRQELAWGLIAGVFLAAGYVCLTMALRSAASSEVGMITSLIIVFVPLLSLLILRRPVDMQTGLGMCIALLGFSFFPFQDSTASLGTLLALLGAVFFAAHTLILERIPHECDVLWVTLVQMACVALLCAALWVPSPVALSGSSLLGALFCGVAGSALGFLAQNVCQRSVRSEQVALLLSLESPFAVFFGMVGGEVILSRMLVGCVLMTVGVRFALLQGQEMYQDRGEPRRRSPYTLDSTTAPDSLLNS